MAYIQNEYSSPNEYKILILKTTEYTILEYLYYQPLQSQKVFLTKDLVWLVCILGSLYFSLDTCYTSAISFPSPVEIYYYTKPHFRNVKFNE